LGGQLTALAIPLCAALLLKATPAQMGLLGACQSVPFLLFSLPAGVWLDRARKFPIMLGTEVLYGATVCSIPLAYLLGALSMPWLYAVGFLMGSGMVVGGAAEQVFLTFVVGREGLIDAQAKFAATDSASKLIGPGIGGFVIQALSAPFSVLINVAGYCVSLWNLRQIQKQEPQPLPSDTHPLHEMKDGLIFVWREPILRSLAWAAGFWHFLFFGFTALQILFTTRELGMSPGVLGLTQTLGGAGILLSSMLLKPLMRRYGVGKTILIGLASNSLGFVLMPLIPAALFGSSAASAVLYGLLVCFFDCGVMLFIMPYIALRQRITPDAMLGRMVSTMRFLTVATAPLGSLAAGYVADHFTIRAGLGFVAAGGVLLSVAMALVSPLRHYRD
jgi:MFS family permease